MSSGPGFMTPVVRRRHRRAVEEASGHGVDVDAPHHADKTRRRRHADQPYSQDQRSRRRKHEGVDSGAEIPRSLPISPQMCKSTLTSGRKRNDRTLFSRASGSAVVEPLDPSLPNERALSTAPPIADRESRVFAYYKDEARYHIHYHLR